LSFYVKPSLSRRREKMIGLSPAGVPGFERSAKVG
jgi:hypothetical protein